MSISILTPEPESGNQLLNSALRYASQGLQVIPLHNLTPSGKCSCGLETCEATGKHPRIKDWPQQATMDIKTITLWWNNWPQANIGIATGKASDIVALDIDKDHGGFESLQELIGEHGELPETVTAITGSGGRHIIFKHPGFHIPNKTDIRPGIDIRADRGQIVAAPSLHRCGNRYQWVEGKAPGEKEPAEMPNWLIKLILGETNEGRLKAPKIEGPIKESSRNNTLASLAGTMRYRGISYEAILAALQEENKIRCVPPLDEDEVEGIARSISRYEPAGTDGLKEYALTDTGNAERFADQHRAIAKYCHHFKCWYVYEQGRFIRNAAAEVQELAKKTVRSIYEYAPYIEDLEKRKALLKHAFKSESAKARKDLLTLAQSEEGIPVIPDELDANQWLFNAANGTIDLRTGDIRPHDPKDLITKMSDVEYDPAADCPRFEKFIREIMNDDEEMVSFLQRMFGSSLAGAIKENVFFIFWGNGKNGKTTLIETFRMAIGDDYAKQTPTSTLLRKRNDSIPIDVARLKGARFVTAVEADQGRRLDEAVIKQFTGRDRLPGRHLYGELFEFDAQFKLVLTTNHKPIIAGNDNGIWRRVLLVPFEVTISDDKLDLDLPEKLKKELPGILNWAIKGCLSWQEHGLNPPAKVLAATNKYRAEMDDIGEFIMDCCEEGRNYREKAAVLFEHYGKWCRDNGEEPLSQKLFGMNLSNRGYESSRSGGVNIWKGLRIKAEVKDLHQAVNQLASDPLCTLNTETPIESIYKRLMDSRDTKEHMDDEHENQEESKTDNPEDPGKKSEQDLLDRF
ncbi:MAG: DNA primase [Firmicutes bacterium]|nr:DNA primase [Bacillota bacterium]